MSLPLYCLKEMAWTSFVHLQYSLGYMISWTRLQCIHCPSQEHWAWGNNMPLMECYFIWAYSKWLRKQKWQESHHKSVPSLPRGQRLCIITTAVYSHKAWAQTLNPLHAKSAETLCLSSSGVEVCAEFLSIHTLACHLPLATLRSCSERNPRLQTVHSTKPSPSHQKVCKCLRLGSILDCEEKN